MSVSWTISKLFSDLHKQIEGRLAAIRDQTGHTVAMGDEAEKTWLKLLKDYLPQRYCADRAFVVDSNGVFSEQLDIVIYDRQYTPFMFKGDSYFMLPAESVYAVFEVKQEVNLDEIKYAQAKLASVRRLHRTTVPIPSASGMQPAKEPIHILGGLLVFESGWKPAFGNAFQNALKLDTGIGILDIGCVAAHGVYVRQQDNSYNWHSETKPATTFLFELIAQLQSVATVPMIDVRAYSRWLKD